MKTILGILVYLFLSYQGVIDCQAYAKRETDQKVDLDAKEKEANVDHWMEQRLNHFDALDKRRWLQRYLMTDAFYRSGGPAILYVGGESLFPHLFLKSGQLVVRITRELGGKLFYLEHRYYGKSKPTSDISTDNLQFLSTHQALEDLAYFIQNATAESEQPINDWILFGASYSASLAVWARLKFPHLVHAVVAASPPLEAKLFFNEYMQSVNDTLYAFGGKECHVAISTASKQVVTLTKNKTGKSKLRKIFNLCSDGDISKSSMGLFHSVLNNHIENVVQYSKGNMLIKKPDTVYLTIDEMCDIMTNTSIGSPVQRFSYLVGVRNNSTECISTDISAYTAFIRNDTWGKQASTRTWLYQTCTEFGWFQTVIGSPFQPVPESFPLRLCVEAFGPKLQENVVTGGPVQTNLDFGGMKVSEMLTRTVIFNGGIDPWHKVSYSKSNVRLNSEKLQKPALAPSFFANPVDSSRGMWAQESDFLDPYGFNSIFVASSSHAEVVQPELKYDSVELKNARSAIITLVHLWFERKTY